MSSYDDAWWQVVGRVNEGPGQTFEAKARPKQQMRMPQTHSRLAVFLRPLCREHEVSVIFYSCPLNSLSKASTECMIPCGNACLRPVPGIRLKKLCVLWSALQAAVSVKAV